VGTKKGRVRGAVREFENRTRVFLHLPSKTSGQKTAVSRIIDFLRGQKNNPTHPVNGFTFTPRSLPTFYGLWFDHVNKQWIEEPIVIVIIDYECGHEGDGFGTVTAKLRTTVVDAYVQHKCKQQDVWIVVHPLLRIV